MSFGGSGSGSSSGGCGNGGDGGSGTASSSGGGSGSVGGSGGCGSGGGGGGTTSGGGGKIIFSLCFVLLPLQLCPSPVYPALHIHEYEPTVFAQSALTSQLWVLVLHSSRSAKCIYIQVKMSLSQSYMTQAFVKLKPQKFNEISADQHHVTISRVQVYSSFKSLVF